MITVRHLTKYFDGKPAISDISTQYSPGECSLVIGASGSGKTVLLKSIIGLLDPDEGEVLFGDVVFNKLPLKEKKATRSQIGNAVSGQCPVRFRHCAGECNVSIELFLRHEQIRETGQS